MPEQAAANWRFVAARTKRGWHTQQDFAAAYEDRARELREQARISVRQVRRWESGRSTWPNRDARRVLEAMFDCPMENLGFRRPARPTGRRPGESGRQVEEHDVHRRTFLGLAAGVTPVLDLADLGHLTAAAHQARRHNGRELLNHLWTALDETARTDGQAGPQQAPPTALGLLTAIDSAARTAAPEMRRELPVLGARGADTRGTACCGSGRRRRWRSAVLRETGTASRLARRAAARPHNSRATGDICLASRTVRR